MPFSCFCMFLITGTHYFFKVTFGKLRRGGVVKCNRWNRQMSWKNQAFGG